MNSPNQDMNHSEELLKAALRREEAPPGFAGRVLAQLQQQKTVPTSPGRTPWFQFFSDPVLRWAALATFSASLIAGSLHYRSLRREQAEGRAAKQQLMLALHIAGSKLQLAKSKVNGIQTFQPNREHETNKSRSKS